MNDNPKAHFGLLIRDPEPHKIIGITVAYPKDADNRIVMGWMWRPEEMNIKAYAAIKDNLKISIPRAMKLECIARSLTLGVEPNNIDNLERMAVSRSLPINEFIEEIYLQTLTNLAYMWAFLMYQFEGQNMSRAGFDPADHI